MKVILMDHQNNYVELNLIARISKFFIALLIMLEFST